MMYNFDNIINRKGTNSLKYDFAEKRNKPKDILPLWVADMDFQCPPTVQDVLSQRIQHGILGYSDDADGSYFEALHNWYHNRFDWSPQPEWLTKTPGVVFAICTALRALTNQGDSVLIQQPVYYPFEASVKINSRQLVVNKLVYADGCYRIDTDDFERQIAEHKVKMFILCSPHNPVGRVWTREELIAMGDICVRHRVYVVSDEIHADFVYSGHQHLVFAGLKPEYADITITCTAPTKTFNLAGLQISNIFIKDRKIRNLFRTEIAKAGYSQPNLMGLLACQTAYEQGTQWLDDLNQYLEDNLDLIRNFCRKDLKGIRLVEPEGTYLGWLDCQSLGLSDHKLDEIIVQKARLWLDAGTMFGAGGEGFQRINLACPKTILQQALHRLKESLSDQ